MKRSSSFTNDYWLVWTASLLFFVAFYTLLVPLPKYLASVGLPDWQTGFILGAFGVASLFIRPLAGVVTDRWGSAIVMLLSTGIFIAGVMGISLTSDPFLLFGLRILQTAGYVIFTTASTALIAGLAGRGNATSMLAVFGIAANLAMAFTPALIEAVLDWLTLRGAFWLAGGFSLLAAFLALAANRKEVVKGQSRGLRSLFNIPTRLFGPMAAAWLFGMAFGAFFLFLPMLSTDRALNASGLAYTIYGVAIIATRLATGRILDHGSRKWFVISAFLAMAVGLIGYAFAFSLWLLLISTVFIAYGCGILHPLLIAVHVERMPENERGRASAAFYLCFDLGIGLGTWLLTPALAWFSLREVFLFAGLVSLAALSLVRSISTGTVHQQ